MPEQPAERSWHRLRPLDHGDIETMARWFTSVDDIAMFAAGMTLPPSAAALERRWAPVIDGDVPNSWFFVVEDPQGALVAFAGIEDVNLVHGTGLVPIWVAAEARGRGIGLAVRALQLDLAFGQLGLHRVTSQLRADNEPSLRLIRACGFQPEGTQRQAWRVGDRRVDVVVSGLLAPEWAAQRPTLARSMKPALTVRCGDDPRSEWPTAVLAGDDGGAHAGPLANDDSGR